MSVKLKIFAVIVMTGIFVFILHKSIAIDNALLITVFSTEDEALDISAQVYTAKKQQILKAHNDGMDSYYLFMPSYTQEKRVVFETGKNINIRQKKDGVYAINDDELLFVLYGSAIPSIHITLDNDLSYITADKENVDKGHVIFMSPNGTMDYTGELKEIKGRGNASWGLDKKPFQFKLSEEVELYDIPATNKFALVSARDYSFLRNYISNEMAKCMGNTTLNCEHVDLYINNEYQGVYELWNKLEPEVIGIFDLEERNKEITDKLVSSDQITTNTYLDDWNNSITGKWWDYFDEFDEITGGYLLESDYPMRYAEEASGFILDSGAYIVSKSPKYLSEDQYDYISDYMRTCEALLYEGLEQDNCDEISKFIDIDSFISKYLVEEVSKNVECSATSQYFYKDIDDVLYAGPVWDYDSAYGAMDTDTDIDFKSPEGFAAKDVPGTFIWWQLLYYNQAFYDRMTNVYHNKLYPYLNEVTGSLIPQWESKLNDSAVMNSLKWKRATSVEEARLKYHQQVLSVSDFLKFRKEFLYNEWN